MMEQLDKILDLLRGLWRFRWVGVSVAWATLLFALLVITVLPDRYQASATVFVDTQTALGAATRSLSVDANLESQIHRVREALLGGPQLAKIAEDSGLTANAKTPTERQKAVDKLRDEIQIYGSVGSQTAGAGTYVISYENRNRQIGLKVVDEFVNSFAKETRGGNREGSEQAQKFLVQQIAELEKRLSSQEDQLADFKKKHIGLLPGDQNDYFKRLEDETTQLEKVETDLSVAINRRNELQKQLHGQEPLVPTGASQGSGSGSPISPGGDTATRLREAQQQLDELLLTYTEKHPKVIELRNNIKQLQKRLDDEMQAARNGDAGAAARTGLAASPVYQNLQMQYNQVGVDIAALQADIANRRKRVADLRSMINTAPEVENQYTKLIRDYGVIKAQYEALVAQLGKARLGEQAARTGIVGFDIVDPARATLEPIFPRRKKFAAAALVFAGVVGVATAFLLNLLRPVFSSVRRLNEVTGLPVLGVVSMTWLERHQARQKYSVLGVMVALFGMAAVCVVYMLVQAQLSAAFKAWIA